MSFKDTLKKNLTPEMFTSVCDSLGDDFDFDVVPRSRLNKVIAQRNELRKELNSSADSDTDLDDSTDDGEPGGQNGGMTEQAFKKAMKALEKKHAEEITNLKKQNIALDKLRAKNAYDPDTVLKSGLLNLDKLELNEDGTLKGLDEAVESLIKDKSYFFKSEGSDGHERGTGKKDGDDPDDKDSEIDSKLAEIFGPDPSASK